MLRTASHIYQLAVRYKLASVVNWKAVRSPFLLAHCLAGPLRRALWVGPANRKLVVIWL
jgi:hypothetical protein